MKKKVIAMVVVGLIVFSGVVGAAVADFIGEINSHKESEKSRLENLFNQKKQDALNEANAELQQHTNQEKQRISSEMDEYVANAAREAVIPNIEKDKRDITKAADDAIKELEKFVDGLE